MEKINRGDEKYVKAYNKNLEVFTKVAEEEGVNFKKLRAGALGGVTTEATDAEFRGKGGFTKKEFMEKLRARKH